MSTNNINIHFLGDAFTGSKYLLEILDKIILIDCSRFQEPENWTELDWLSPPIEIGDVHLIVLPCVHANHSDLLPELMKHGFKGQILGAPSKASLLERTIKTPEPSTFTLATKGYTREAEANILPDLHHYEETFNQFKEAPEGVWINLDKHIRIRFQSNEKIQEYVFIELEVKGERLFLTGDVGQKENDFSRDIPEEERTHTFYPNLHSYSPYYEVESSRTTPESSFWIG